MTATPAVLVVDDDRRLRSLLEQYLTQQGFEVHVAAAAAEAEALLACIVYDAMVLDIMMPHEDGLSFARRLRQGGLGTPVLFLSARDTTDNRIEGFEAGGDDYVTKPFEPRELLLRLQAIIRRQAAPVATTPTLTKVAMVIFGPWSYDRQSQTLYNRVTQRYQTLTTAESQLLRILGDRLGQVVSRDDLLKLSQDADNLRTVDVQVTRLRRKIEDDPKQPRFLQTNRGIGYVLYGRFE